MSKPNQPSLIQKAAPYLHWVEKGFFLALLAGILFGYFNLDPHGLVQISLAGLSVVFFISAYIPTEIHPAEGEVLGFKELLVLVIVPKVLWISCAVTTIGILFYTQASLVYKQQLLIGISANAVATFIMLMALILGMNNLKAVVPVLFRSITVLLAGLFLFIK